MEQITNSRAYNDNVNKDSVISIKDEGEAELVV